MKKYIFLGIFIFLFAQSSLAETQYVVDFIRITLRTGPGVEHKVVDMIESGQKLEVLEANPDWSRVQLDNGKEGWILSRFLTSNPPSQLLVTQLTKETNEGKIKASKLFTENEKLKEENRQLNTVLESSKAKLDQLNSEHQALKVDSSDFLDLKTKYETISAQMARHSMRAETLEKELARLQLHKNIRWFLSGAGVFLVGFILGLSSRRQRRRSSLS
jgi:SH3 domain protein